MRYGRRFTLPIDPWPRASLGERLAVTFVLGFLLLLPFFAAGAGILLATVLVVHVYRSFGVGAALRTAIDRRVPIQEPVASRSPAIGLGLRQSA